MFYFISYLGNQQRNINYLTRNTSVKIIFRRFKLTLRAKHVYKSEAQYSVYAYV